MGRKHRRRVSDMVRAHLADLLGRKASDPRLRMVTITDVDVTVDAVRADIHYSVLGGPEERARVQAGLESASGWLRRELGSRIRLRNTPELVFHYDPSLERGENIAGILDELGLGDGDEDGTEPG
jgi:ribosome-binding factor A